MGDVRRAGRGPAMPGAPAKKKKTILAGRFALSFEEGVDRVIIRKKNRVCWGGN